METLQDAFDAALLTALVAQACQAVADYGVELYQWRCDETRRPQTCPQTEEVPDA